MIVNQYYLRNGHPIKSKQITNSGGQTVSQTNPPMPGDVQIDENQYNVEVAALEAAKAAYFANIESNFQANQVTRTANIASVTPKLLALGLTQQEVDTLFGK